MNYSLHQLKVFLTVAQVRSVTKAAEALHLTQPAVSIQLKKLQEQFDLPLIEVIGRKVHITEFGKEIALASERILQEVQEIKNKTLAYKGALVGQLNVSVVSTGKYVMPYFMADFLKKYPEVELKMDVTNKTRVVESLEKNEVDFALVSVLPKHLQVLRIELMKNELYLVTKHEEEGEPLAKPKDLLTSAPFIYREQGSATRQAMERFISSRDIAVSRVMELTSNEAVKQAVLAGLGTSVMPLIGIKTELRDRDLRIVPTQGLPVTTHWNLIWLKGKRFNPVTSAYVNFIEANKDQIIHKHFQWYENMDILKP